MANIFIVEDEDRMREWVKYAIGDYGHKVVAEADTLPNAVAVIEQLSELNVEIAILDGNLTVGDSSGNDGKKIAGMIREACPEIKILTWSLSKYDWGDAYVEKGIEVEDFENLANSVGQLVSKS